MSLCFREWQGPHLLPNEQKNFDFQMGKDTFLSDKATTQKPYHSALVWKIEKDIKQKKKEPALVSHQWVR